MIFRERRSFKISYALFISFFFLNGCATVREPQDKILAKINDKTIAEDDFLRSLAQNERETYLAFKKQKLDQIMAKTLLEQEAKKRGVSLQDLLKTEVFSKANVTHEELHAYYNKNKKTYKKKKHEEWEKEITALLRTQKEQLWAKTFIETLAKTSDIKYYLPMPQGKSENKTPQEKK